MLECWKLYINCSFLYILLILKLGLYIVVLLFAAGFAVFLAAYEKLVSKQLRTVDSAAPAEVTNGHMLESGPNKRLKKEDTV